MWMMTLQALCVRPYSKAETVAAAATEAEAAIAAATEAGEEELAYKLGVAAEAAAAAAEAERVKVAAHVEGTQAESGEEDVAGSGQAPWVLASPAHLQTLVGAKVQLAGVLRAQYRPKVSLGWFLLVTTLHTLVW
jgi:hypothetical protein